MSFEPIFVFAADLHLRPRTWTRHPDLQGDAYASLNYIAAYCRDMRLPLVLGGDIFNSRRPDPLSVTRFNSVLGANDGCRVYYVQGNHDACGESPWPGVAGWGYPLHNRTVTLRDRKEGNNVIRVHGLDWTPREKLQEALAAVPTDDESPFAAVDVLVCHQSWSELQGIGNTDGTIDWIPDHVKILLTGDYHVTMRQHCVMRRGNGPRLDIYSPGSTHLYKINESPDKFFFVVGRRDGEIHVEQESIPTRRLFTHSLQSADDLDQFCRSDRAGVLHACAGLPEELRKPIVKVSYRDDIHGVYERLREFLGDEVHFFPDPIHVVDEVEVDLGEDPETFDTLPGAIRRMENDSEVADSAIRLLNAEDPAAEIETMYQEHCDAAAPASASE